MHQGSIPKEGQRGHTDVFREGKQAVDRSSLIASENQNKVLSIQCFRKKDAKIHLAFSLNPVNRILRKQTALHQLFHKRTVPEGCRKNHDFLSRSGFFGCFLQDSCFLFRSLPKIVCTDLRPQLRPGPCHSAKILRNLLCRSFYSGESLVFRHQNIRNTHENLL